MESRFLKPSISQQLEPKLFPLDLFHSNAPINVFPERGEGGRTRAFDSSSQPMGRGFDFISHPGIFIDKCQEVEEYGRLDRLKTAIVEKHFQSHGRDLTKLDH